MTKRIIYFFVLLLLITSAKTFSQHYYNYVYNFNGTSSYFAVPHDAELNTPNGITTECWVNIPSYPVSVEAVMGKNYSTSWTFGITNTGTLLFQKGAFIVSSTGTVPVGGWNHIAFTYDGVGTGAFYINGSSAGITGTISGTVPTNTDSLYIGCDRNGGLPSYFFSGKIDNVRLWNYARTANQILSNRFGLYQFYPASGNYSGLIATYMFDNDGSDWSGGVFNTGYSRNITLTSYIGSPVNYEDYSPSIYLDANSYVVSGNWTDFNATTGITLETWIRKDTTQTQNGFQNLLSCSSLSGYSYALYLANSGNNLALDINSGAVSSISTVPIGGRWTHVAATYNASNGQIKLFVNGDSVGSSTGTPQNIATNATDSFCIGFNAASCCQGNKFIGQMQEIRVSKNVIKTPAQIKADMYVLRSAIAGTQPDIVMDFNKSTNWARVTNNGLTNLLRFRGSAYLVSPHYQQNNLPSAPLLFDPTYVTNSNFIMSTKRFYVPDNNPTGIADSIFVAAGGNLQDIKVALIMNHTYAGDMRITLINPLGTSVMLTPNSGNQGGNDIITIFDMTADSTISYSSASIAPPYTPRIKPANPFAPLYGQNAGGWWKLKFVDVAAGDIGYVNGWGIAPQYPTGTVTNTQTPFTYELAQNYPNPFNPSTSIKYSVALDNITKLVVYDITGREVSTLINGFKKAGNYEITFDASKLSSGVYFYKLESGSYTETKKMMLIK